MVELNTFEFQMTSNKKRELVGRREFVFVELQPPTLSGEPSILWVPGPSRSIESSRFSLWALYREGIREGRLIRSLSCVASESTIPYRLSPPEADNYQQGIRVLIARNNGGKVDIIVCPEAAQDVENMVNVVSEELRERIGKIYYVPEKDKYEILKNSWLIHQVVEAFKTPAVA